MVGKSKGDWGTGNHIVSGLVYLTELDEQEDWFQLDVRLLF